MGFCPMTGAEGPACMLILALRLEAGYCPCSRLQFYKVEIRTPLNEGCSASETLALHSLITGYCLLMVPRQVGAPHAQRLESG